MGGYVPLPNDNLSLPAFEGREGWPHSALKKLLPVMPALSKKAWLRSRASLSKSSQPMSSIEPRKPSLGR